VKIWELAFILLKNVLINANMKRLGRFKNISKLRKNRISLSLSGRFWTVLRVHVAGFGDRKEPMFQVDIFPPQC